MDAKPASGWACDEELDSGFLRRLLVGSAAVFVEDTREGDGERDRRICVESREYHGQTEIRNKDGRILNLSGSGTESRPRSSNTNGAQVTSG